MSGDFFERRNQGEDGPHVRLAVAGEKRSRYVKVRGKLVQHVRKPKQRAFKNFRNENYELGRSFFHRKSVKAPSTVKRLLVSGDNNVKIGKRVLAKQFFGYDIFTLSLEERATCPRTCEHWENCYGNAMPYAKRIDHTAPDFLPTMASEISQLFEVPKKRSKPSGRKGILIRLHALGDFYSPDYVEFWLDLLRKYPKLAVYGYTARKPDSATGIPVSAGKAEFGKRFSIRWSDGGQDRDCTKSIERLEDKPDNAFQCPEQSPGFTKAGVEIKCDNCGLCWSTDKNVAFLEH